jgi:hypothetical protein
MLGRKEIQKKRWTRNRNRTAFQQVLFQKGPILWRLDTGLFSRQIHSSAAPNKMGNPLET